MKVTRAHAEQILGALRQRHAIEPNDPDGPKVVENWDWSDSGPVSWAILWEGDYDWPRLAEDGGLDEEIANELLDFMSPEEAKRSATRYPLAVPDGIRIQAINGWAISIHEE